MQTIVEIFSQGEEIVSGQIVDTNAAWLSQKLVQMGFVVKRHSAVGDNLIDLKNLLQDISLRADFCICTGGLGPTIDDLTAQAVAESFSKPLQLDAEALQQITQYFSCRKREMVDSNRKQAFFPQGALRIDNEWGTAPGFSVQHNRCWFVFVPGVPYEMKHMFNASIAKQLAQHFSVRPGS
ncbi:competence/damage-inducible protein CinA [methanotrophic bacterial endosymbiont of Bathymodiolus sp.]|nr:competence/damage-inducible protein CinA [methanotrophic bacterial endosymbiont of Bathymodiolus sp.]